MCGLVIKYTGEQIHSIKGDFEDPFSQGHICPKAIALIGNLPETLEDRSIVIPMRRKARHEKVARMRHAQLFKELEPLRRMAARWAKDNLEGLRDADPPLPEELHDRAADNWGPLVAIADLSGGVWPKEARDAVRSLSGGDDDDDD